MQRNTVPHQIWAVSYEWWRGMFFFFSFFRSFHRAGAKCPTAFKLCRPHIFFFLFDKLVVRLLRLMHISQKSFLPSFLCDLPVGHDKSLRAPLDQTESFQDNANYDKFHHPALCAFPLISLIRESRGGSRCFSWGACCLIEWCWNRKTLNLRPPPPRPSSPFPSQLWPPRLFCLFIYLLSLQPRPWLRLVTAALAERGHKRIYVKSAETPRNDRLSATVSGSWGKSRGSACVRYEGLVPPCEMSALHATVSKANTALWPAVTGSCGSRRRGRKKNPINPFPPLLFISSLNRPLLAFAQLQRAEIADEPPMNKTWETRVNEMARKAQQGAESRAVPPSLNRWQYGCIEKGCSRGSSHIIIQSSAKSRRSRTDALESWYLFLFIYFRSKCLHITASDSGRNTD